MANADLDVVIRQLAKQQHKSLMAAVKSQRDRTITLAAKAKDAETRQHYRQLAKDILEIGSATVKRLQMSADNAAYSYARSVRQVSEAASAKKPKPSMKKADATAKPAKKASKKVAKKATTKAKG